MFFTYSQSKEFQNIDTWFNYPGDGEAQYTEYYEANGAGEFTDD